MREEIDDALGLMTAFSPTTAPEGALWQARDICIDRPKYIEERPGFGWVVSTLQNTLYARYMVGYGAHLLTFLTSTHCIDETAVLEISGLVAEPRPTARTYGSFQSRGSLYLTGANGIQKIAAITDTSWGKSGLQVALAGLGVVSVASNWLANNYATAYRMVLRRMDANTYIRRSQPSGRLVIFNAAGATRGTSLTIDLQDDVQTGDVLEIYRASSVDGTVGQPSDQMFLVQEVNLNGTQISAKSVSYVDLTSDTFLTGGTELYTNSTQQGILQSKGRPPWCSDVTLYNRMAFYGDTRPPWRFTLKLWTTSAGAGFPSPMNLFAIGGSIPIAAVPGTTTAGLFTVGTGAVDPRKFVGCIIVDGAAPYYPGTGGNLQLYSHVVSATYLAGVGTMTLDKSATGTGAITFRCWPTLAVAGVYAYGTDRTNIPTAEFNIAVGPGSDVVLAELYTIAHIINIQTTDVSCWIEPGSAGTTASPMARASVLPVLSFEWADLSVSTAPTILWNDLTQYVLGTVGTFSQPSFGDPAATTNVAITQPFTTDARPGTFFVSQIDEPESVPAVNNVTVGDSTQYIRRMIATRSALWMLKDDGVFRVAGYSPEGLRVDPIDPTLRLLHSEAACASTDIVYAWTIKGVAAISDAGIVIISEPIRDQLIGLEQLLASNPASAAGIFMAYDQTERRVLLAVPSDAAQLQATKIFVFSERTQAWTTWALTPTAGVWDPGTGQLALALMQAPMLRHIARGVQRTDGLYAGDDRRSCEILTSTAIGDGTYTVVLVAPTSPALVKDDALAVNSATSSRVVSVNSASSYVMDNGVFTPGQKPNCLRAAQCRVEWNIQSARGFDLKLWTDARIVWNLLFLMTNYNMTFGTGTQVPGGYASSAQPVTVPLRHDQYDYARKVGVPMDAGLGATFSVVLDVAQGGAQFLIGGLAVTFENGGDEVSR